MFNENNIYTKSISLEYQNELEKLTQSKDWDSSQFNKIITMLSLLGNGQSIPAFNRPETIHLQSYRKYFEDLLSKTKETNKEHGRAILVDQEKKLVIMSGKITVGDEKGCMIDPSPQLGKEKIQNLIGTIHTHPIDKNSFFSFTSHGFSGQDYKSFLSDSRQQFMIITYGDSSRLLVFKTSVTPNRLEINSIEKRINGTENEFLKEKGLIEKKVVDFNKMACLEFGLTLYIANKESNDLFMKINVTE